MFHVKHLKSNPVIWCGFSRYYLSETRPEPPRLPAGPGLGYRSRNPLESLNESGARAPGPWAARTRNGPATQARTRTESQASPRRSRPPFYFRCADPLELAADPIRAAARTRHRFRFELEPRPQVLGPRSPVSPERRQGDGPR